LTVFQLIDLYCRVAMIATSDLRTYFVEDNPLIRNNLIETLQELAGITVLGFAETEQQGCMWLTGKANLPENGVLSSDSSAGCPKFWDLAIVDLFLKQGGGLGVLKACRERLAGQKVVVLSNYTTPDIRARCLQLGADAVFDKSREIDALIEFCQEFSNELHQQLVHDDVSEDTVCSGQADCLGCSAKILPKTD
jgi:DNA-binding NarL/FixJ family response regulator